MSPRTAAIRRFLELARQRGIPIRKKKAGPWPPGRPSDPDLPPYDPLKRRMPPQPLPGTPIIPMLGASAKGAPYRDVNPPFGLGNRRKYRVKKRPPAELNQPFGIGSGQRGIPARSGYGAKKPPPGTTINPPISDAFRNLLKKARALAKSNAR